MVATIYRRLILLLLASLAPLTVSAEEKSTWWNKEWTIRKKVTIDPAAGGVSEAIGAPAVLLRLHDGNFNFGAAKEDGGDIRAVAADDKTALPVLVEKIDTLLNEAFVWVKAPEVKPGAPVSFWLYYGNANAPAPKPEDAKAIFDAETVLAYHFAESNSAASDATTNKNDAQNAGVSADGTIIARGVRFDGKTTIKLPEAAASLAWTEGAPLTWSAWIKPSALAANAVIFSRREGGAGWTIGLDNGVPFVEVTGAGGTQRSNAGEPIAAGAWRHLAVVASGAQQTLFLDGKSYGTLAAAVPALKGVAHLGGDVAEGASEVTSGFVGELDELRLSKIARPGAALLFAATSEGTTDAAGKLVAVGNDEESGHAAEGELGKHVALIKGISKDLTLDGWIVIYLCGILAVIGGIITIWKFTYLNRIGRATKVFLGQWEKLSANLHVLDHGDEQVIRSMGGTATPKVQRVLRQSPLYHLYQIGFAEIQHRASNAGEAFRGLSGRSMQAIKATLDGGLVREVQRLNSQLVFLTIGIAGGPYLGLLGTVIGVMITFAVIAKSGEVEVNSIAPGIAGALLATVAGLAVAIPCLFAYSYISTRIKDAVSDMQVFIDEFVAKLAETYPEVD